MKILDYLGDYDEFFKEAAYAPGHDGVDSTEGYHPRFIEHLKNDHGWDSGDFEGASHYDNLHEAHDDAHPNCHLNPRNDEGGELYSSKTAEFDPEAYLDELENGPKTMYDDDDGQDQGKQRSWKVDPDKVKEQHVPANAGLTGHLISVHGWDPERFGPDFKRRKPGISEQEALAAHSEEHGQNQGGAWSRNHKPDSMISPLTNDLTKHLQESHGWENAPVNRDQQEHLHAREHQIMDVIPDLYPGTQPHRHDGGKLGTKLAGAFDIDPTTGFAVNPHNNSLDWHHGSTAQFRRFRDPQAAEPINRGLGTHLAGNIQTAFGYAGGQHNPAGNIYTVNVQAHNPIDFNGPNAKGMSQEFANWLHENRKKFGVDHVETDFGFGQGYHHILNTFKNKRTGQNYDPHEALNKAVKMWREDLKGQGYDSVSYPLGHGDPVVIPFHTNQIKNVRRTSNIEAINHALHSRFPDLGDKKQQKAVQNAMNGLHQDVQGSQKTSSKSSWNCNDCEDTNWIWHMGMPCYRGHGDVKTAGRNDPPGAPERRKAWPDPSKNECTYCHESPVYESDYAIEDDPLKLCKGHIGRFTPEFLEHYRHQNDEGSEFFSSRHVDDWENWEECPKCGSMPGEGETPGCPGCDPNSLDHPLNQGNKEGGEFYSSKRMASLKIAEDQSGWQEVPGLIHTYNIPTNDNSIRQGAVFPGSDKAVLRLMAGGDPEKENWKYLGQITHTGLPGLSEASGLLKRHAQALGERTRGFGTGEFGVPWYMERGGNRGTSRDRGKKGFEVNVHQLGKVKGLSAAKAGLEKFHNSNDMSFQDPAEGGEFYSMKTSAPIIELVCNKCGDTTDPDDDSEGDMYGAPGDTCLNCGGGILQFASKNVCQKHKVAHCGYCDEDRLMKYDDLNEEDEAHNAYEMVGRDFDQSFGNPTVPKTPNMNVEDNFRGRDLHQRDTD